MTLKKRFRHTTEKNGVKTELDIIIYTTNIIWYFIETIGDKDGDEFTEDQPIDDYVKNGPPSFAADLPSEIINEISRTISE